MPPKRCARSCPWRTAPSKECHILMSSGVCSTAMEMGILTSFGWTKVATYCRASERPMAWTVAASLSAWKRKNGSFRTSGTSYTRWMHGEDGRLAVLVSTTDSGVFKKNGRPRFLQQGFCLPSQGCSGRGQCQHLAGKCECFQGHELVDCSGCQPGFSSVVGSDHRLSHGCAAYATDQQGIRCSHRGVCYDDKLAKAHSATSTKTVTKVTNTTRLFGVGNGSCICSQSRFQKIFFALNLWKLRAMESYTLCQKFPFSRGFLFSQWPPDMLSFCQPWS